MRRTWRTWIGFCLGLALVLIAMAWISVTTLRLDAADAEARQNARLEEAVRLALWRIDSSVGPLVSRESVRPHYVYAPFYAEERAYTRLFAQIETGDVLVPSPLLRDTGTSYVRLHFQQDAQGSLTSPQVPLGNMRDLAEARFVSQEQIERAERRLDGVAALVDRKTLLSRLSVGQVLVTSAAPQQEGAQQRQLAQRAFSTTEWEMRYRAAVSNQITRSPKEGLLQLNVSEGTMRPVWVGRELFLARRLTRKGGDVIQGCWLDWPLVRAHLLNGIADLLPRARLVPMRGDVADLRARMVAALPVQLVSGSLVGPGIAANRAKGGEEGLSPVQVSLVMAWVCVAFGAGAVAMFLSGAMALSARRGAFVSAVTHELRTPLTTFRMYTEMLSEGMVPDEARRHQYLTTLRVEAERLSHLVENVLSYARLERGTARGRLEAVPMVDLLSRSQGRLGARAAQARMDLVVETEGDAGQLIVNADGSAVEQILFNLVDNACKYAASAGDRRIHVIAGRGPLGMAALRVCDHGPGIEAGEAGRLFRPFHKSARDAARSAPGVGLGLALCRRLARGMGGDLVIEAAGDAGGARFLLTLAIISSRYI